MQERKHFFKTLKSGFQFFIGAAVVLIGAALIVSFLDLRKINSLPRGWAVLREPGEVSALLVTGEEIWAGGRDGLTIIDRDTLTILPTPAAVTGLRYIRALQISADGSLWVAHDAGLEQFAGGQWHHFSSSEIGLTGPAYAVLAEPSGRIWVGGEGGLAQHEGGLFKPFLLPKETKITAISTIFIDSSDTLWVGSDSNTNGGLLSYSDGSGWQSYSVGRELNHSSVTGVIEDRTGVLWVATGFAGRGGVSFFSQNMWAKLERQSELEGRKVRSVFEDSVGRIWLGYEYDGLSIFDGKVWTDISAANGLAGDEVKAVLQDQNGSYWIATPEGLSIIQGESWQLRNNR